MRRIAISERDRFLLADSIRQDVSIKRETTATYEDDGIYRQATVVEIPYLDRRGEPLARELRDSSTPSRRSAAARRRARRRLARCGSPTRSSELLQPLVEFEQLLLLDVPVVARFRKPVSSGNASPSRGCSGSPDQRPIALASDASIGGIEHLAHPVAFDCPQSSPGKLLATTGRPAIP